MDNGELLKSLKIDRSQREEHTSTPRWRWLVGAAVLALLLGGGLWWFLDHRPIEVQTATAVSPASEHGAGTVLQATGYVTARRQATVSAQITGTLTEVLIEEGDRVEKGQVLARLEDSGYRANLNAAKASAQAALAQVGQLRAQLDQARHDATRAQTLAVRGLVSRQAAEQARTLVTSDAAQLNALQRQAQAAQAQAQVAQVNFDYTVVRAPFAGVITDKSAQIGEIISPLSAGGGFTRTGVGTIVDMDSLEVDVDVNEAYIGRVQSAMPAEAVLDAYPDWRIPAHVIAIVPAADRGKATVKVRVALEQKDARIVPDMGVRVSFLEHKAAPAAANVPSGVLVPASAVVRRDGRPVVFVVENGKVEQRAVTPVADKLGDMQRLPSAVNAGDRVVVAPSASLREGSAVRIKDKQP
jgi:RND family efflux transporter MFP subunit